MPNKKETKNLLKEDVPETVEIQDTPADGEIPPEEMEDEPSQQDEQEDPNLLLVASRTEGGNTCSWKTPTSIAGELLCMDGTSCNAYSHYLEWSCCGPDPWANGGAGADPGGRAACSADYPVMCDKPNCAAGGTDFCCWDTVASCQQHTGTGERVCEDSAETGGSLVATTTTTTSTTTAVEVMGGNNVAGGAGGGDLGQVGVGQEATVIIGGGSGGGQVQELTEYCGDGWVHCNGYIAGGGNVAGYQGRGMTMEEAKQACNRDATCGGITTNKGDRSSGAFWLKTKSHNLRCYQHGSWDTCWPPGTEVSIIKTAPYCGSGGWKHCKGHIAAGGDVDFDGVEFDFGDSQMTMQQAKQKCQGNAACGAVVTDKMYAASGGFWFKKKTHDLRCIPDGAMHTCWLPGTSSAITTAHGNPGSVATVDGEASPYYCGNKDWVHCKGYMSMGNNVPGYGARGLSIAEARAKCAEEPTCGGFTTNKGGIDVDRGTFWLKTPKRCWPNGNWDTCWKPGTNENLLKTAPYCGSDGWTHCKGYLARGGNLERGQQVYMTMEEAKLACLANSDCGGITTDKGHAAKGSFWLKSKTKLNVRCYPNAGWDLCWPPGTSSAITTAHQR